MNHDTAGATLPSTVSSKRELAGELRSLVREAENRSGRKINRVQLARRIHVSRPSLYAYLNGTTLPPSTTLDALLLALGVPPAQMRRLADARDDIEDQSRGRGGRPPRSLPGTPAPTLEGTPRSTDAQTGYRSGVGQVPAPPDAVFQRYPREVARLDSLLRAVMARSTGSSWTEAHRQQNAAIATITGPPRSGKTALAVHWARRVATRFPDGQIRIDLGGTDPRRPATDAAEALARILCALAVPLERIPSGPQARIGLYRSLLVGRHVLMIMDGAHDADQVRPLLPVAPGCLTLVTSRNPLTGLASIEGALRIELAGPTTVPPRADLRRRTGVNRPPQHTPS
jgi:hypothetical protein